MFLITLVFSDPPRSAEIGVETSGTRSVVPSFFFRSFFQGRFRKMQKMQKSIKKGGANPKPRPLRDSRAGPEPTQRALKAKKNTPGGLLVLLAAGRCIGLIVEVAVWS